MTGTRIQIIGGDSAHYNETIGMQSRLIVFPDGQPRHLTMSNWHWEIFDREHSHAGETYLPQEVYEFALEMWVRYSFNGAAEVPHAHPTSEPELQDAGAPLASFGPFGFEDYLRFSFELFIKACMARAAGQSEPAGNDG